MCPVVSLLSEPVLTVITSTTKMTSTTNVGIYTLLVKWFIH